VSILLYSPSTAYTHDGPTSGSKDLKTETRELAQYTARCASPFLNFQEVLTIGAIRHNQMKPPAKFKPRCAAQVSRSRPASLTEPYSVDETLALQLYDRAQNMDAWETVQLAFSEKRGHLNAYGLLVRLLPTHICAYIRSVQC
jgi:hypothetical protein